MATLKSVHEHREVYHFLVLCILNGWSGVERALSPQVPQTPRLKGPQFPHLLVTTTESGPGGATPFPPLAWQWARTSLPSTWAQTPRPEGGAGRAEVHPGCVGTWSVLPLCAVWMLPEEGKDRCGVVYYVVVVEWLTG